MGKCWIVNLTNIVPFDSSLVSDLALNAALVSDFFNNTVQCSFGAYSLKILQNPSQPTDPTPTTTA